MLTLGVARSSRRAKASEPAAVGLLLR